MWIRRQRRKIFHAANESVRELDRSIYRELGSDSASAATRSALSSDNITNSPASDIEATARARAAPAHAAPGVSAHDPAEDDTAPTIEQPAMKSKNNVVTTAAEELREDHLFASIGGEDGDTVELEDGFFNPESTINTTHVMIPSALHEPPPPRERRRSPVDVLRQAIEREPGRHDLRLKLLELYYTAAAQNQQAFLQIARQLAKDGKVTSNEEWAQIAQMGRKIAPGNELFAEQEPEDDDQAVA
jgi:hypothetical protein